MNPCRLPWLDAAVAVFYHGWRQKKGNKNGCGSHKKGNKGVPISVIVFVPLVLCNKLSTLQLHPLVNPPSPPPPSPPTLVTGDAVWMVVKEKKISIKTMEEEVVGKGCSFSKFLNGTKNCNVCFVLLLVLRPSTGPSNVVMLYNFEKSWMFRVQAKKIKRRRY